MQIALNARFVERLPKLTEQLANLSMNQDLLNQELAVAVGELQDFVQFELLKANTTIDEALRQTLVGGDGPGYEAIAAAQEVKALLDPIAAEFPVENSTHTLNFLNDLFMRLTVIEDRLNGVAPDEDEQGTKPEPKPEPTAPPRPSEVSVPAGSVPF